MGRLLVCLCEYAAVSIPAPALVHTDCTLDTTVVEDFKTGSSSVGVSSGSNRRDRFPWKGHLCLWSNPFGPGGSSFGTDRDPRHVSRRGPAVLPMGCCGPYSCGAARRPDSSAHFHAPAGSYSARGHCPVWNAGYALYDGI